jgi:hypothetical protein
LTTALPSQPGYGPPTHVLETDAKGRFLIEHAPVGEMLLRIGTCAELERGDRRREIALELVPGANPALEIPM